MGPVSCSVAGLIGRLPANYGHSALVSRSLTFDMPPSGIKAGTGLTFSG